MTHAKRAQNHQTGLLPARETLPHPQAAPMGNAQDIANAWSAVIAHRIGFAFGRQRAEEEGDVWESLATITGVRGSADIIGPRPAGS